MSSRHALALAAVLVPAAVLGAAPPADRTGCADHPLFTRMDKAIIASCQDKAFDALKVRVGEGRKAEERTVEGRFVQVVYRWERAPGFPPSRTAVLRNYQNAARAIGGKVLHEGEGRTTLLIARGGSETWAEVSEYGGSVTLRVVERRAMAQEVEASADALAKDLAATGHAAVYGILFDTGSADLRPESGAALGEIARLLAAQPGLRLRMVGHTDAVGDLAANQRLSEARAAAALSALATMHGVDRARLSAHGVGPLCPVATNDSDEGRARNRRVELVPW